MACINVHCPRCDSALVYRHGQNPKGQSRFRCRECRSVFQLTYTYQARNSMSSGVLSATRPFSRNYGVINSSQCDASGGKYIERGVR